MTVTTTERPTVQRNWSRTVSFRPVESRWPVDASAVVTAIADARARGLRVKAVGAGHSFSAIAEAPGIHLDTARLSGLVAVDAARGRVRFGAGTLLRDVPALLAPHGLAMENLGDIDAQTLAGAVSTGTHGTGVRFGGLATQVTGVVLATADGALRRIDEEHDAHLLDAVRVSLGALGVLVEVELQCVPAFALRALDRAEPLDGVVDSLLERLAGDDHVEFYWFPHTRLACTRTNTRLPADADPHPRSGAGLVIDEVLLEGGLFRAACALGIHSPRVAPLVNRVAARAFPSGSHVDRSHRVFTSRRITRFVEAEFGVPLEALPDAFRAVRRLIERRGWSIEFPIEVRAAAADDAWLSTAHGRATGYLAVHRYHRHDPAEYFGEVERVLAEFDARPHWGKLHTLDSERMSALYPRFDDFRSVRDALDPERLFANPYLERVLGP